MILKFLNPLLSQPQICRIISGNYSDLKKCLMGSWPFYDTFLINLMQIQGGNLLNSCTMRSSKGSFCHIASVQWFSHHKKPQQDLKFSCHPEKLNSINFSVPFWKQWTEEVRIWNFSLFTIWIKLVSFLRCIHEDS